jgi:hypothetical protein
LFTNDIIGQLTEEVMDLNGIPTCENNDKRTSIKDKRTQCQQRAIVLNSKGARERRKRWIEARKSKTRVLDATRIEGDNIDQTLQPKRQRAPNRPKEVIDAEKNTKRQRVLSKALNKQETQVSLPFDEIAE